MFYTRKIPIYREKSSHQNLILMHVVQKFCVEQWNLVQHVLHYVSTIYVVSACGGQLEGPTGIFESPGYPSTRGYRRYCLWKIVVPVGRRVKVELLDFDLETSVQAYKHRLIVSSVT